MTHRRDPNSVPTTGGAAGGTPRRESAAQEAAPQPIPSELSALGTRVPCPSCGHAFEITPLAGNPSLTKCPLCQKMFRVDDLVPTEQLAQKALSRPPLPSNPRGPRPDLIARPEGTFMDEVLSMVDEKGSGIREETLSDGWRVSAPYFSFSRLFKALAAAGLPLTLFFLPRLLGNSGPISWWSWVLLALTVPGLWYLLLTLLGRTRVEVRGDRARLSEGVWPLTRNTDFNWADVTQVRAVDLLSVQQVATDDGEKVRSQRESQLELIGPLVPIQLASDLFGGNFWALRDTLNERLVHPAPESATPKSRIR